MVLGDAAPNLNHQKRGLKRRFALHSGDSFA